MTQIRPGAGLWREPAKDTSARSGSSSTGGFFSSRGIVYVAGVRLGTLCALHKAKLRAAVELAPVEFSAAIEAGDRPLDAPGAGKILSATRALIKERACAPLHWKGQGMASPLIGDAQVAAGFSPFSPVGRETAPTGAKLREQVSELVAQRSVDLGRAMFA